MQPLVTVVIPVKNGMRYLAKSLDSIRFQTLREIEIIVIDDASSDGTFQYLNSLMDSRLRLLTGKFTCLSESLNFGIKNSTSQYIARMDADDIAHPQRLEKQFMLMKKGYTVVGSYCDTIDENETPIGLESRLISDPAIRWGLLFRCEFMHPSTMFRRDHFIKAGQYNLEYKVAQDYDLWTRMAYFGPLHNTPTPLLQYRKHSSNISHTRRSEQSKSIGKIAGHYANALDINIPQSSWYELHRFLTHGELDNPSKLVPLAHVFSKARTSFLKQIHEANQETKNAIRTVQNRLRWRCLDSMKASSISKVNAARAIRLFDPDCFSFRTAAKIIADQIPLRISVNKPLRK